MRVERLTHLIGLVLVLVAFGTALTRVLMRGGREAFGDKVVVRFAHWRIEEPTIAGFDAIAAAYMQRNPGVRVEQITIPLRVWRSWQRTQLVGETAPDLMLMDYGMTNEMRVRHLTPLTEAVEEPNPYNQGTSLEGVPWRDTFINGLSSPPNYIENLMEVYAATVLSATYRLFYNLELLETITGSRSLPGSFSEFLELNQKVQSHDGGPGGKRMLLAAANDRALGMFERLFQSQTQKLLLRLDRNHDLGLSDSEWFRGYLTGAWRVDDPLLIDGLRLMDALADCAQPGFMSYQHEDATYLFLQQRAVCMAVATMDVMNIKRLAEFEVGVADLPFPTPADPEFGRGVLGPNLEQGGGILQGFALTRVSRHPEVALDFLRFLTSQEGNQLFVDKSGNVASIEGVRPNPTTAIFQANTDGYVQGPMYRRGLEADRVARSSYHVLGRPGQGWKSMLEAMEERYPEALRTDLHRLLTDLRNQSRQKDSMIGGYLKSVGDDPETYSRVSRLLETQSTSASDYYRTLLTERASR